MALRATSRNDSVHTVPPVGRTGRPVGCRSRLAVFLALAAALAVGLPASGASADDAVVGRLAAAPSAPGPVEGRSVTISLRAPIRIVAGDRVTLQSVLRFSGRAWEDAKIEILANGVVISRTIAMRGGLWYAPRTPLAAGDYEFSARALSADGTREISDVLRITVSPPILVDPESLAGKSATWVG
jgi:hypothetical protein